MLPGEVQNRLLDKHKPSYARWAFFIGVMLAGAEAKPCVSIITNSFTEQQVKGALKASGLYSCIDIKLMSPILL